MYFLFFVYILFKMFVILNYCRAIADKDLIDKMSSWPSKIMVIVSKQCQRILKLTTL